MNDRGQIGRIRGIDWVISCAPTAARNVSQTN